MAPVLIPIAIAAATAGAGLAFGAVTAGAALFSVAATALTSGLSYLMKPSVGGPTAPASAFEGSAAPANVQRNIPVAQAIPPRVFAYGQVRTGGSLFFQDSSNPYLYVGCALSDGPIDAVTAVYFGDTTIPLDGNGDALSSSLYSGKFKMQSRLGTGSQATDSMLLAAFTSQLDGTFRQLGVACAVVRMHWGDSPTDHNLLWGDSISPSFSLRGMKVYDPRVGGQSFGSPTTWTFSSNPALCVAHALTQAWGVAIGENDIDWTSVAAAATVCDASVNISGVATPIFSLAGLFQAGGELGSQLQDMLSSFRGRITFSNGKYSILADVSRSSVFTVTDDDVLEIREFDFAGESRTRFNAISAVYYNANDAGRRTSTKPYLLGAAIAAEGLRETSLTLPFTAQSHSAQILAYRELVEGRDGRRAVLRLTDAALYLSPSDVITIASTDATFMNGLYSVVQVDLADGGAIVVLKGYTPDTYTDPSTYLV